MPLEATHIKFALDKKNKYHVQDLSKYLSGSVYPDSRYVTKISRKLTHSDDSLLSDFGVDDFKKGWASHFLCDKLWVQAIDNNFPEIFENDESRDWGSEHWLKNTALKNILDLEALKMFDIKNYLLLLVDTSCPNGESVEQIQEYYKMIRELYGASQEVAIDDLKLMWIRLGIGGELAEKVTEKSREFASKPELVKKIREQYENMLNLPV